MGFEYNFIITETDHENLARSVDGINDLDKLLRAAPNFTGTDGSTYSYSPEPVNSDLWQDNISIQPYGICLCIYSGWELRDYFIKELLDRCGRVEVEDA